MIYTDLGSGESYYMVEIKSLKRIIDAGEKKEKDKSADEDGIKGQAGGRRILCFVDEVLRGTNTVERIAASAQILRGMDRENVMCFAATHDIELTGLHKPLR